MTVMNSSTGADQKPMALCQFQSRGFPFQAETKDGDGFQR